MGSNEDHSLRFATPAPQQSSQNFPTENAPSETARTTIEFPPAHPLCQLRNLFCKSEEEPPPLSLCLFPEESRIPLGIVKNISCEIEIMKLSLTHTAEKRLRQISPDQTQSDADEQVYLYLSCDRMAAWVMLFPPTGSGKALTVPQLQRTLLHRGVIFGIDQLALKPSFVIFFVTGKKAPSKLGSAQLLFISTLTWLAPVAKLSESAPLI